MKNFLFNLMPFLYAIPGENLVAYTIILTNVILCMST